MGYNRLLNSLISALFFVLLTTSTALCVDLERIVIPYGLVEGDWWTGLAIHNKSSSDQTIIVSIYDTDGNFIGGSGCLTVAPKATMTDLIENYVTETVSGRISIYINTNQNEQFSATVFMGNGGGSQGFGFDTYESEDYDGFLLICGILPIPFEPL